VISKAVTVETTATLIVPADDRQREAYIHNGGGAKIYLGNGSVTTTNGYHLANNESLRIFVPSKETLYGIVASGTNMITVLTPDLD